MPYYINAITGEFDLTVIPGNVLTDVTADIGTASPVDNNLNVFGDAAQGIQTIAGGDTLSITAFDASDTQKGVSELATDPESVAGTDPTRTIVPTSLKAKLGLQTDKAIPYGQNDSAAIGWTNALTDGQIAIGSSVGTPQAANLTSSAGTIVVANSPNVIDLDVGGSVLTKVTAEDASTCVPVANNLNIVGTATNGINTTAAGNTLTVGMSSPFVGNFTFENNTAATTLGLTVDNNDNDPGSIAAVHVIASPGGGDAFTLYEISGGARYFAMGIDNSDNDYFKFTHNTDPSGAGTISTVNPAASTVTDHYSNLIQTKALIAGGVNTIIQNTDNTNIASDAFLRLDVGGSSGGDAYVNFLITGAGNTYSMGIDNTDADEFKITTGASPSNGTELLAMTTAGVITLANDLDVSEGGTGVSTLTSHGILIGNGTGDIQATAEPSNGQILIGSTGNQPVLGSLASAGGTVVITPGAGTINVEAGASVPTTFTAENASTCVPALNNLNIVGTATNGINTTAAGSTMTVAMASPYSDGDFTFSTSTAGTDRALTVSNSDNSAADSAAHFQVTVGGATSTGDPYTNYLVTGAGTYSVGIDNSDNDEFKITTGASPSAGTELITMTSAGVITLANDLDVSEGGTGVSTLTSHGILIGNGTGDIQATAEPSNGQILIGSTGNFPTLGTITAGSGVGIVNAAGSITISAVGGGLTWKTIDADQTAVVGEAYFCNKAGLLSLTLPAASAVGDVIEISNINTALGIVLVQGAGQQIYYGTLSTTAGAGGTLASIDIGDSLKIVCRAANTFWQVVSSVGNWAVV